MKHKQTESDDVDFNLLSEKKRIMVDLLIFGENTC